MIVFIHYLFSDRKPIYREIAAQHRSTPFYVYRIAHGRRLKNNLDVFIAHTLMQRGILENRKIG